MSKETRSFFLMLGLPFAAAALLLAAGVAWKSLQPVTAHADGAAVSGKEGYAMTTIDVGGGVTYLCVSTYSPYVGGGKGENRQFLTFYEIKPTGVGKAELHLVGSRCIEFDRGFAEVNFKSAKGYSPVDLQKLHAREVERLNREARSSESAPSNEAASNAPRNEPAAPSNMPSNSPRSNGG